MQLWKDSQRDAMLLAVKIEERAKGQGMQVTCRRWKRQGKRLSSRLSKKEHSPFRHLTVSLVRPVSDF